MDKKPIKNTITAKQHKTVLEALRNNPNGLNTFEIRDDFSISDPPARIGELKRKGVNILTKYKRAIDRNGQEHNGVAHNWLISEEAV